MSCHSCHWMVYAFVICPIFLCRCSHSNDSHWDDIHKRLSLVFLRCPLVFYSLRSKFTVSCAANGESNSRSLQWIWTMEVADPTELTDRLPLSRTLERVNSAAESHRRSCVPLRIRRFDEVWPTQLIKNLLFSFPCGHLFRVRLSDIGSVRLPLPVVLLNENQPRRRKEDSCASRKTIFSVKTDWKTVDIYRDIPGEIERVFWKGLPITNTLSCCSSASKF